MSRTAPLLLICMLAGCEPDAGIPTMPLEIPILDANDPKSIEAWEKSEYNYNSAKIVVIDASYLHGDLSAGSKPAVKRIPLEVTGARDKGIAPSQQAAIDFIMENEQAVFETVREAIYADYQKTFDIFHPIWGDEPEIAPVIKTGTELDAIVTFGSYYIHHPTDDGPSNFGIQFWVPWTEDDQGVLLQKLEVIDIGQAYSAMPGPPE